MGATVEMHGQIRSHESVASLLNLHRSRNPQIQERLAGTEAYGSAKITNVDQPPPEGLARSGQDTITQRSLVDEPSPGIDILRLLPTTEQHNRQDLTSEDPARQQSQLATPGNATVKSWRKIQAWRNRRLRFRARVEDASQQFGDIMWTAFKHNEYISAEVYSESGPNFPTSNDPQSVLWTLLAFEGDIWVLTAAQLIEARKRKLIVRLPHLTEDEVSDRNKGDLLVKLLSLLQVSWMVIQILTRAMLHVSSTPLEILTLSFAACAFITFILLLDHPQDVNTSIYIDACRLSTIDDTREIADLSPGSCWFPNWLPCVSNNAIHWDMRESKGLVTAWFHAILGVGAAVFGGIHLVAWNFAFPTGIERTLWRTSSLITAVCPLATMLVTMQSAFLIERFRGRPMRFYRDRWLQAFVGLNVLAIVLARLFVIVEAFRSLYFLPQDAYFATWAANAPYIA